MVCLTTIIQIFILMSELHVTLSPESLLCVCNSGHVDNRQALVDRPRNSEFRFQRSTTSSRRWLVAVHAPFRGMIVLHRSCFYFLFLGALFPLQQQCVLALILCAWYFHPSSAPKHCIRHVVFAQWSLLMCNATWEQAPMLHCHALKKATETVTIME